MNVLCAKDISFRRNDNLILDKVSWTIAEREHWALLGANGSGKTTLLKIVTAYEWPTSGTVEVLGKEYGHCDVREVRKAIGWVSNALERYIPEGDPALDVVASGLDATMGLYRQISRPEKESAMAALRALAVEPLATRPFGLLSQGEQQRVLIARALVHQPAVLVLDEPCTGLDPAAREHFLADLANLAHYDHAPAIIMVTHHVEEIGSWVNRVLVLKQGHVLQAGTPSQCLTAPTLTDAFGYPCHVDYTEGRSWLRMG